MHLLLRQYSVLEDNSIQVYVDCRWISRQILRRSTLEIPMDTLLYVGGMPGRSYQVGVSRERYIDGWVREGEACMKGDQVVHKKR